MEMGFGNFTDMVNEVTDLESKFNKMQTGLDTIKVQGESGAGLVKASATAKGTLVGLDIDPSILIASEKEVVEDLILAAIRDALAKADEVSQVEVRKLTKEFRLDP